ncbi:Serine/threonine protein kinase [hydrothermal vent metagenome]|uniref:Serine/threonine protein kinase n=1 Tax=hydrothermal vent metagenome TaxID=652676 RepID=A0A1W1CK91_9ZZZZ
MESNEHLEIGYKIGGHNEVVKVLGQGGFGIVYLVKDTHRLDALFVIKELFSRDFSFRHRDGKTVYNKAEAKNIFKKIQEDIISEVNILQRIRNPNIVEGYGFFEENNTIYSIMEFIDGVDLDKYLKETPPFTEAEGKDLLLQIINGIKEIHALNILHRDMKPSNIMRTKDGIYKIIDFTTNRTYVDKQMTTVTSFQSPIYTPPELSGNKKSIIGKFSDIYSIGMTICRVLAEDEEILPNITDRFIDDSDFQRTIENLDIKREFKDILRKMTEINPKDRFQSLDEVEEILKNMDSRNSQENWIDTPQPREERSKKVKAKKESKSSWTTTIGIVLLVIMIGLGLYAYKMIQDNKKSNKKETIETVATEKLEKAEESEEEDIPFHKPSINQEEEVEDTEEVVEEPESTPVIKIEPKPQSNPFEQEAVNQPNISLGTRIEDNRKKPYISLGERIGGESSNPTLEFNRQNIERFLNSFLASSESPSIDRLLSYYDSHVDKYFNLRNVTHADIYRDRKRYGKKWVQREFTLLSFTILRTYKKDGVEYCHLQKSINYNVISSRGKRASGVSKSFMTLKKTANGFKVKSIYTIK